MAQRLIEVGSFHPTRNASLSRRTQSSDVPSWEQREPSIGHAEESIAAEVAASVR
jgi:hypothetical protein